MNADDLMKDEIDEEHSRAIECLSVLVEQADLLTDYVIQTLIDGEAIKLDRLKSEWIHRHLRDDGLKKHEQLGATRFASKYNHTCRLHRNRRGIDFSEKFVLPEQPVPRASRDPLLSTSLWSITQESKDRAMRSFSAA